MELADIVAEKTISKDLLNSAIDALWTANMALADKCIATSGKCKGSKKQIIVNKELIRELKKL